MLLQIHIELSLLVRTIPGTEIKQWIEPDSSLGGFQSSVLMFSNWNMTKHLNPLIKEQLCNAVLIEMLIKCFEIWIFEFQLNYFYAYVSKLWSSFLIELYDSDINFL